MKTLPKFVHHVPEPAQRKTRLRTLFRRLTEPPDSLPEPQRGQARLLLTLLLALVLSMVALFPLVVPIRSFRESAQLSIYLILALLLGLTYGLAHTRRYMLAAGLTVCLNALVVWIFAFADLAIPDAFANDLPFVVVSILLGGLLLSVRFTLLLAGLHLTGVWLSVGLFPQALDFSGAIPLSILVLVIAALTVVTSLLHERSQKQVQWQEQALREAEDRFHLVSYATSDVVWDWEFSSGRVWRNRGLQRLFGFKEDQIGDDMAWWQAQIHPADRQKFIASIRTALEGGEKFWSKEYRLRRTDGDYAYVFDRSYIIHDGKGKPIRMLGALMDITSRKQSEESLWQEAIHDPLTGLFNRRYMEEMLELEIQRTERTDRTIGVILLDIDHFKQVNDTLGHAAGDALLRRLGAFLLDHVRGTDVASRFGGDEFILILPNVSLAVARQRALDFSEGLRELMAEQQYGLPEPLTTSVGVAVFPVHGETRRALLEAADAALYKAKKRGRNRVVLAAKRRK